MTATKKFNGNKNKVFYLNEVIDSGILATEGLSNADGLIYIALVRYSNGGKDNCFPSQEYLAEKTGLNIRTVKRAIQTLIELKFITLLKQGSSYSKKSNEYKVYMPSQIKLTLPVEETVEPVEPVASTPAMRVN